VANLVLVSQNAQFFWIFGLSCGTNGGPIWMKFRNWCRMTCRLRWCVEMETRCKIPIWRTFRQIQWHVIPEPRITLQGAATWWIYCNDSRAIMAHCRMQSPGEINVVIVPHCRVKEFHPPYWKSFFAIFYFLMQFRLWRAAAFVSSPIHLLWKWINIH